MPCAKENRDPRAWMCLSMHIPTQRTPRQPSFIRDRFFARKSMWDPTDTSTWEQEQSWCQSRRIHTAPAPSRELLVPCSRRALAALCLCDLLWWPHRHCCPSLCGEAPEAAGKRQRKQGDTKELLSGNQKTAFWEPKRCFLAVPAIRDRQPEASGHRAVPSSPSAGGRVPPQPPPLPCSHSLTNNPGRNNPQQHLKEPRPSAPSGDTKPAWSGFSTLCCTRSCLWGRRSILSWGRARVAGSEQSRREDLGGGSRGDRVPGRAL